MKKFLLLLMAIILAFSLIACDDTTDGSSNSNEPSSTANSSDKGNGNTSDNNGENEDVPGDNQGGNEETPGGNQGGNEETPGGNQGGNQEIPGGNEKPSDTTGLILTQALINQFSQAASMKLEFNVDVELEETEWIVDYGECESYTHGIAKFVVTIAKTKTGFNLKVEADVQSDNGDGMTPDVQGAVLYIVDGVIYKYNKDLDLYLISEMEEIDTSEIEGMIAMILQEINLTEDDMKAIFNELGATFLYVFNVVDNKGSISADYKPALDNLLAYLQRCLD